jgi:hypothetical protein
LFALYVGGLKTSMSGFAGTKSMFSPDSYTHQPLKGMRTLEPSTKE